jgi:hypothetical protein
MAARGKPPKRRINWLQISFLVLSFVIVLSMILSMLPPPQ